MKQTAAAVACAGRGGDGGRCHFDARIMDLAPAAAIVKENKRLSERPSQEFNAVRKKRGKKNSTNTVAEQQHGLGRAAASDSLREDVEGTAGVGGVDLPSDRLVFPSRLADLNCEFLQ